ncbi:hypothetical protein ACH5RR_007107 [Cinchona calisaya]|uniref:Uncharacterized protein n=1 Tax=Cinchona calisaya TaxID=153742 RepID=A0ABD3AR93_9GENT
MTKTQRHRYQRWKQYGKIIENEAKEARSKWVYRRKERLESKKAEKEPAKESKKGSVQIIKGTNMVDKVILTKPNSKMAYHLKPFFVQRHLNGILVSRIMVDNGAPVNILAANIMKRLGKTIEDLVPTDIVISKIT